MPPVPGQPKSAKKIAGKKKASWRKAIDISDITTGLDEVRAEERQVGSSIAGQTNDQLFVVDTEGDADVVRPKPPKKLLRSQQILAERTAHPAVYSRPAVSSRAPSKRILTHAEKDRLRRIAGREVKGPFGLVDETHKTGTWAEGSAVFAGPLGDEYDAWKLVQQAKGEWDDPRTFLKTHDMIKTPKSYLKGQELRPTIDAVTLPVNGQSYNPTVEAHQELLRLAAEAEERRTAEEAQGRDVKDRMMNAKFDAREGDKIVGGMEVDVPASDDEEEEEVDEDEDEETKSWREKKQAESRSKKEHAKRSKARQAEADRVARAKLAKQHNKDFGVIHQTRKTLDRNTSLRAKLLAERADKKRAKALAGLKGKKVGGHLVMRGGDMDVQLGDELSESWRQLEPEGNLFRDRFASLQHRALVEPRKPQTGKRKLNKHKSYEKHPWKKFE